MLDNDLSPEVAASIAPALLLVAGCLVAGLVDIWRGPVPRYLPRAGWTAVALASFPWGLLAYLFLGRGARTLSEGPSAPGAAGDTSFDVVDPVLRTTGLARRYPDGTGVLGVDLVV